MVPNLPFLLPEELCDLFDLPPKGGVLLSWRTTSRDHIGFYGYPAHLEAKNCLRVTFRTTRMVLDG